MNTRVTRGLAGVLASWAMLAALVCPCTAEAAEWPTFQADASRRGRAADQMVRVPLQGAWTVAAPAGGWDFATPAAGFTAVYAGGSNGEIAALDVRTGARLWSYANAGPVHLAPALSSGTLVFGSGEGRVVALDADTGAERWSFAVGSDLYSSPAVYGGAVYFAANDGDAYALDLANGHLLWRAEVGDYVLAAPAVSDNVVLITALGGRVLALERATGAVRWSVKLPALARGTPALDGPLAYVGAHDGILRALRLDTGAAAWSAALPGPIFNGLAVDGDSVYAASLDGTVTAFDKASGARRWDYAAGAGLHAAPIVVGGTLVIGGEDAQLHLLDVSSGALLSQTVLPGRVAAPAAASQGTLYVLTDDGSLTALQSPNLPPEAPADLALNGQAAPYFAASSFTFTWQFSDPDSDDRQAAFSLDLASGTAAFDSPLLATGVRESEASSYSLETPLEEGRYFWRVRTFDLFGASSPFSGAEFVVDRTAPLVAMASPLGGERFIPSVNHIVVDFSVADAFDPAPAFSAFLVQLEDRGGPRGAAPERVAVSTGNVLSPLDLDDGVWRLEVAASDAAGNSTTTVSGSFEVIHDVKAPRTALAVATPKVEDGGLTTITRATLLNLSSIDDLANDDGIGLGVAVQSVSIDGVLRSTFPNMSPAPGEVFSSSFTLAVDSDGLHFLAYHARDTLGNDESVHVTTVAVDNTSPQTSLTSVGGREYIAPATAGRYVSSDTRFSLLAVDPVIGGAAAGVADTRLKDNGVVFSTASATFTLTEGLHTLDFMSEDRVGNLEAVKHATITVDASAPNTSLSLLGGRQHPGVDAYSFYASPETRIVLAALDPPANGVASGAASTEFADNDGTFQAYVSSLTLIEGVHALSYRSQDNVGNLETSRSTNVLVDQTPPVTEAHVGGTTFTAMDGTLYISSAGPVTFSASDPTLSGSSTPGSGVALIEVSIDSAPFAAYASALTFGSGRHVILYRAVDNVGNAETMRTLDVRSDATSPETALAVSTPSFGGYVSPVTAFALTAVDPGAPGEVSGVSFTRYRINDGAFAAYSAAFTLSGAEGAYALDYQSQDMIGNIEVLRSASVLLDRTPPVSTVHFGTPTFAAAGGIRYVAPFTPVSFSAADPALASSGTTGSGVRLIEVSLDGTAFVPYAVPLTFTEGRHIVLYRAVDNVGNVEAERELRLHSDATPPITAFNPSAALFPGANGTLFAPAGFAYALAAMDPTVADVASDIAFARYALDGGTFQAYMTTFTLTEGIRRVDFQSQDNVANLELLKSATVFVDATPPATTLSLSAPISNGYVSDATRFVLSAVDPAVNGVASGVKLARYRVNGGAFVTEPLDFALSGVDGAYTLEYQSEDNTGNLEVLRSTAVFLDRTPPVSTVQVGAPSFTALDGALYVDPATPITLAALDSASGVERIEVSVDSAPFKAYAAALTFAEGRHTVQYRAVDKVGNTEPARTLDLRSDATPPLTTFTPSGAFFTGSGGERFAPLGFWYALPASDPVVNDVASDIAFARYALDGGAFQVYTATFTLAEGIRRLDFQSRDNVGNSELLKSATVFVDATAPLTSLQVVGGRQFPGAGAASFYASSDTRLNLLAIDPLVGGSASGVALTRWQDNGGALQTYAATLVLAEGAHALRYQSLDNVSNLEILRSTTVLVDATPPVSAVTYGAPNFTADGTVHIAPATPVSFAAADPALPTGEPGSGVARVEVAIDGGAYVSVTDPLTFGEGRHDVLYRALDNVGNVEAARAFAIQSDATPPSTALSISTPLSGGYVSSATRFVLAAVDPIVNGAASGVKLSRYRVNGGSFGTGPLDFGLSGADGAYSVEYQSEDKIGNLEVLRSTGVFLDQAPPVTAAQVGAPSFTAADGTLYVDPAAPVSLAAADAASGVERIEVSLDGAPYAAYVQALTFSEGRHTVLYRAVDKVGNVETARTLSLRSDATPPLTTFVPSGTLFAGAGGALFSPAGFTYAFSALDPIAGDVASGVAFTRFRTDSVSSGLFGSYASTFSLTEGIRRVEFQSQDNLGHLELLRSATVFVDATAPLTALDIGLPRFDSNGTLYVSTGTPLSLASQDPVVLDVASGLSSIAFQIGVGAFSPYVSTFTLQIPDGSRAISWHAADNVGNQEGAKTSTVFLDATAPHTSLQFVGGRRYPAADAASFYASSDTRLALVASDPPVNGSASGVALTRWQDDGGAFQAYSAALTLAEGAHALRYQSQDNVSNLEVLRSTTALVDATPPVTSVSAGAPSFTAADGTFHVAPATPVSFVAADPALPSGQTGSGAERVEVSVDGGAFAAASGPLTFGEGRHEVLYRALDNVGNVEAVRALSIQSDATPPVATLSISTPVIGGYVSGATRFILSAVDPVVGGAASGVKLARYRVNGGAFVTAPLDFGLSGADGAYTVEYLSEDNIGNLEISRSTSVFLDQTPPVTSVTVGASSYTAVDGTLYVDPASPVAMTAADAASGVERIEVSVDGAPFTAYAAALTFAEGRHAVAYRAVDKVGNAETARTLSLRSDATPPLTTFAPSGALFAGAGGQLFAPLSFSYALPAADPVVNGVASGLAFTRYALDSAAFQPYAGTFALTEGVRRVDFQSADNVGHFELLRGATVFVDATAPLTALGIGAPQYPSSGTVYVSTATPFSLVSQDPVIAGVASGVSVISFRLDAAAFGSYLSDFRIPGPDGPRSVSWFAADNVGNVEAVKNANVELDATAPRSSLLVIGGRQVPGPDASAFYASSDTRIAFIGEDPVVGGAASGLAWIRFQDNGGGFQGFAVPLALGEGRHALGYQGQDNVFNLEVLRSTTVLVDATPPVTAVSIGVPNFTDADGTIYVAPASSISFSASDPSLPSGEAGSGVDRVEVSVDGSVYAAFAAPLTFSEGLHAVRYRALDLVGNVEAERTLRLRSDATPPASGLAIGEPSFSLSSAAVLVSAATQLSVSVLDPEVNAVASGVKETFYRIVDVAPSTASFLVFTASFTLTGVDRAVSVEFFSRDRVLNTEPVSSRALLLDSTRPDAVIDSPHGGNGVCSVVKGMIPVRGTARDLHFASYSLESAAGQDASAGFVLVSSGTAEVDAGLLGNWDARASAGWRTLRLTVIDQVRNASVSTLSVYVGDPGRLMVLGNHETFNMPQGVAAGVDGRIYVADTNDDRVQVFSATGTALVSLGRGHGRAEDESLRLNKPRGVAVDAEGAIFVADTNNDRVLKLSATGQILLEAGRRKPGRKDDDKDGKGKNESQEFQPGKGPGEFRKPSGIAVDAAGNIFVSDTDNNRVQKLGPDGTPLLAFSLPPALGDGEEQDHDCEDPELGRPVGIALDAAGNIYVADPRGARALKFDPAGRLLMTLPIESAASKPGRPEGIAVSPDGGCLLVSDPSSSRVIKFDAAGARTLAFGERGKILDNKPLPRQLVMRKPAGLALDAGGKLYVADRNNDRIQVFGLPTGEPASVVPPPVYDHDDEHVARDVVDREEGGQVERDDRAGVSIPAGALAEDLRITVSTPAVAGEGDRDRNREDQNLKVVSAPVEYGPEGTKFKEAVTLVLPYTPGLIAAQGLAEDSLKINYWNKEKGEWEALESEVDKKNGTVKAKTPHFSLYQVLGSTGASAAIAPLAADASFGLKDMYAFPNPVRGQGPVAIRVQPGLADSVTVRVYDVSGRKVHESSNFSDRGAFDDGNGKGQQFTYDHVWDVSGVGSGVYTFVVTATKNGERDIHKTGKVGIVK